MSCSPTGRVEESATFAVLPQEDPNPGKLANIPLHIIPAPWKATLLHGAWRIRGPYEEDLAIMRGPAEFHESNARVMAAAPELARVLRLADAEDDQPPEGSSFYGDVVQAAHTLGAAIRAGILPDNSTGDNTVRLLERIKQQDRAEGLARQRNATRGEQVPGSQ